MRALRLAWPLSSTLVALCLCACSSDGGATTDATGASGTTGGGTTGGTGSGGQGGGDPGGCTAPAEVPCSDEVFLEMNIDNPAVAPGLIQNEPEGAGFVSIVDATAGGAFAADPDSYVYGRFDATGLTKVEISDEQSLTSMDWDIAFRRYVVRINSGHSGPSCVTAARLPGMADYDALAAAPDGLTFRKDEYFTASCEIIADGTGLENSPATALSSYWTYPGCVQMTGNVYVVQVADGRQVKLTVTNFYNDAAQQQCQTDGTVPMTGSDSANIRLRWAPLP